MDQKLDELVGATEIIINSTEDIMKIAKIVQKERATRGHGINDTSSRSHAFIELKMYRVQGDNLHVNFIKFMDLSGSERLEKAGTDTSAK